MQSNFKKFEEIWRFNLLIRSLFRRWAGRQNLNAVVWARKAKRAYHELEVHTIKGLVLQLIPPLETTIGFLTKFLTVWNFLSPIQFVSLHMCVFLRRFSSFYFFLFVHSGVSSSSIKCLDLFNWDYFNYSFRNIRFNKIRDPASTNCRW